MRRLTILPGRDEGSGTFRADRGGKEKAGGRDVRATIIIPAYGQPSLTSEALRTALDQHTDFAYAVVVVNDGCPQEATHDVCQAFAAAHPGRVFYLRKRNAGLSAARNTGIEFSLAAFPALEAVYFLDCDNRMGPHLLQRLLNGLRAGDERTGWAYGDIDKFGFAEFSDLSGPYSPLEHLFRNISEAGSMASRRMLDAGIRFDTNMRRGVEDWEFWLQGLENGFRGTYVADAGFRYRRRGESMLVAAERDFQPILDYIRQQHPGLFAPRAIMEREIDTKSRHAVYHPDTGRVRCFTMHGDCAFLDRDDYLARLLRSTERPGYGLCPGHLFVMDEALFAHLERRRLLSGILWVLECAVQRATCAALRISPVISRDDVLLWRGKRYPVPPARPAFLAPPDDAHIVAIEAAGLLADEMSSRDFRGIATQQDKPLHALLLNAEMTGPIPEARAEAGKHLAALGLELATVAEREQRSLWRSVQINRHRAKPAMPRDVYGDLGLPSLFPSGTDSAARRAALIVETPASNTLRVIDNVRNRLQIEGWEVHLIVLGLGLDLPSYAVEGFSEIVVLPWRELRSPSNSTKQRSYLGTMVRQLEPPETLDVLATLAAYHLAIAIAGDVAHALMGSLRRFKLKTWCVLASGGENSSFTEQVNVCTAFEPAYDAIFVEGSRERHLCSAWGIPESKLHLLDDLTTVAVPLRATAGATAERT